MWGSSVKPTKRSTEATSNWRSKGYRTGLERDTSSGNITIWELRQRLLWWHYLYKPEIRIDREQIPEGCQKLQREEINGTSNKDLLLSVAYIYNGRSSMFWRQLRSGMRGTKPKAILRLKKTVNNTFLLSSCWNHLNKTVEEQCK